MYVVIFAKFVSRAIMCWVMYVVFFCQICVSRHNVLGDVCRIMTLFAAYAIRYCYYIVLIQFQKFLFYRDMCNHISYDQDNVI